MGLRGYLLRRTINTIVLILFVIILNFAIFQLLPGPQGVIANLLQKPRITDKSIIGKYENQFGLCSKFNPATGNCTLATPWERFGTYFINMLTFNFGVSYQSGHPIFQDMIQTGRLYNTLLLLGVSTVFSLLIGIFLGVFVAAKRGTVFDTGWVTTSLVTFSLPTFWMGLLGGAIITETVFNWDGLGHWIFNAINYKDFPVMQAMFYIIALTVIAANFVADILLGVLDPRIKYE